MMKWSESVDVVIMPLLVTPRSLNRVVALDQQKLFYNKILYDQQLHNIMSKCGSFNGSQEESHSYDNRSEEEGNWLFTLTLTPSLFHSLTSPRLAINPIMIINN